MLGPLPTMHRVLVSVIALLVFVGVGAWTALMLPSTIVVSMGVGAGLGMGAVSAYLLLHQPASPEPHRIRRHRLH